MAMYWVTGSGEGDVVGDERSSTNDRLRWKPCHPLFHCSTPSTRSMNILALTRPHIMVRVTIYMHVGVFWEH